MAQSYMIVCVLSLCIFSLMCASASSDNDIKKTSSSNTVLINVGRIAEDKVQSYLLTMFGESYAKRARQHLDNSASKAALRVLTIYQDPEVFKKDFIQQQQTAMNGNNFFANPSSEIGQKMCENLDILAKKQTAFSIALLVANKKFEEEVMKVVHAMDKDIYDLLNR